MRASTASLYSTLALALGGCANAQHGRACTPVSSWASPAYHCEPLEGDVSIGGDTIELKQKIEFETDSSRLTAGSRPLLDQVVTMLRSHSDLKKVRIDGHTDSTSTPEHNQTLSEQRAASVKEYLIAHGIAAERLSSTGFGQTKPIASNETDAGRADNRRVEIHIVERSH